MVQHRPGTQVLLAHEKIAAPSENGQTAPLGSGTARPMLEAEACYRAMRAKDRRFDGVFFVGVKTTGIYCRPICPARLASAARCQFFRRAGEAEQAGFRAC